MIFPVIALTLTIFMITFISEAIREAFDPKSIFKVEIMDKLIEIKNLRTFFHTEAGTVKGC